MGYPACAQDPCGPAAASVRRVPFDECPRFDASDDDWTVAIPQGPGSTVGTPRAWRRSVPMCPNEIIDLFRRAFRELVQRTVRRVGKHVDLLGTSFCSDRIPVVHGVRDVLVSVQDQDGDVSRLDLGECVQILVKALDRDRLIPVPGASNMWCP